MTNPICSIHTALLAMGQKVTARNTDKALRNIRWMDATAYPQTLVVGTTIYRWEPDDQIDVTISSFGTIRFLRHYTPAQLALWDIQAGLVGETLVGIRFASDSYKKRGSWRLSDYDDPNEAEYHRAHRLPHRYLAERQPLGEDLMMAMIVQWTEGMRNEY